MQYSPSYHRNAFTLVELSISLVIIGLLVGGVLVGQNLIRTSTVRNVVAEAQTYATAIRSFKDRYQAYPGDFARATDVWGAAHATPVTCQTTVSARSSTATCNGNGDGRISSLGTNPDTTGAEHYEMFRLWQQLVNAGLITGYYNGIAASGAAIDAYEVTPLRSKASATVFGTNSPESKLGPDTGWNVSDVWSLYNTCNTDNDDSLHGHVMVLGSNATGQSFNIGLTDGSNNLLSPAEMLEIDTKTDDGHPSRGNIQASGVGSCYNNACDGTETYTVATTTEVCGLITVNQF